MTDNAQSPAIPVSAQTMARVREIGARHGDGPMLVVDEAVALYDRASRAIGAGKALLVCAGPDGWSVREVGDGEAEMPPWRVRRENA